jgi:hypothetical protein
MGELPRVFVGTMHSQEGDFQECLARVQAQEGVTVSHFIVSGLKEKEAHNALWHAWRHQGSSHDLFVKLDADTVLRDTSTLLEIWRQFEANPCVTGLQAPLHDYMTDDLINGLNAFNARVTFNDTKDELYCDRQVDTGHDVVLRGTQLPLSLRPAGLHCHRSTLRQAFHYGLHRALKGQQQTIELVQNAWNVDRDDVRAMALLGAYWASDFAINRRFNYSDDEFKAAFAEAEARLGSFSDWMTHGRKGEFR